MMATRSTVEHIAAAQPARSDRVPPSRLRPTLTSSGLIAASFAMVGGLAALNVESNLLLLLVAMAVGAMVFNVLAAARVVRGVTIRRHAPASVAARSDFPVVYVVCNRRRRARAWSLTVREMPPSGTGGLFPRGFATMLEPGERVELRATARCRARGRILLEGVRVESSFPFGLVRFAVDWRQPAELTVFPALGRLRRPMDDRRLALQAGVALAIGPSAGEEEFYGLRDYRTGDSLRRVHWRRSARTGELLVREHVPPRGNPWVVLMDPWPEPDDGSRPGAGAKRRRREVALFTRQAEQVITAAATAVCDALEHGHRVGLIIRAAVPVIIPPAGGRGHRQRLLRELAEIQPPCAHSIEELVSGLRWTADWAGRCLVCTPVVTEAHRRILRFVAGRSRSILLGAPGSDWFEQVFVPPGDLPEKGDGS